MNNRNYIFLGLVLILSLVLFVGANTNSGNIGKYQISTVAGGGNISFCYILDTETGAVAKVFFNDIHTVKESSITAKEVQELLSP